MNAGLSAELGRHRLHGQAVGLAPAVAAALADPLVDEHPGLRLGYLAALALAALLGGALLVVHEHGDAGRGREDPLGLGDPGAVPHGHPAGQPDVAVAAGVLGGDDDPGHALGQQHADDLRHGHAAGRALAAGHGHGRVVQQLVGHVRPRGHRGPDGQRARVVEGAVAEVLREVLAVEERRHADPLDPLAAHLGQAGDRAGLGLVHQQHQGVAADAGAHQGPGQRLGRAVVRAARAEVRHPAHQRQGRADSAAAGRPPPDAAGGHPAPQRAGDHVGVQLAVGRDELGPVGVALAGDGRLYRAAVEHVADGSLEEGAFLLDDQDLLEPLGELADRGLLERPWHADAQQAERAGRQAVLAMPRRRSAASTSRNVCPAATTPRTSPGPRPTTRFSRLRREYSRARRSRVVTRSRSSGPA